MLYVTALTMRVTEVVMGPILIPWIRIMNSTVRSQYVSCRPTTLKYNTSQMNREMNNVRNKHFGEQIPGDFCYIIYVEETFL